MNRPLSVLERVFYHDRATPVNAVGLVRLDGPLPLSVVERAARRTQTRHPLLCARFADGPRLVTNPTPGPLSVECHSVSDEEDVQDWVGRELARAFPETGPLARVVLLDGGLCSAMLVAADHTVFDGRSIVSFVRDLLTWVDDPEASLPSRPELPTMDALLPTSAPVAAVGMGMAAMADPFARAASTVERAWSGYLPTPRALAPRMLGRWLDPELSKEVVERARAAEVSVGALLVALLCTTLAGDRSPWPRARLAVATPMDVRPLLDGVEADDLGLYAWAPSHLLDADSSTDPWHLARHIGRLMRFHNRRSSLELAGLAMQVSGTWSRVETQWIARRLFRFGVDYNVVLSNLGRIDVPATAGAARVRSVGLSAWMPGFDLAVVTQAFDGRIEINLMLDDSSRIASRAGDCADELVRRLRAAVEQPAGEGPRR